METHSLNSLQSQGQFPCVPLWARSITQTYKSFECIIILNKMFPLTCPFCAESMQRPQETSESISCFIVPKRIMGVIWVMSKFPYIRTFNLKFDVPKCLIHYPSFAYYFSSQIHLLSKIFYTKYFILTFSIDVVSILANGIGNGGNRKYSETCL